MLHSLLDLLFPRTSLKGMEGEWITEEERRLLSPLPVRFHRQLLRKRGLRYIDEIVAAGSYRASPLLRNAIRSYKYGRVRSLHPDLARLMTAAIPGLVRSSISLRNNDTVAPVVCAVPLHWTRLFARGFNQADILGACIAHEKGWRKERLLRRRIPTGHQAWRTRTERLGALREAFAYVGPDDAPPYVLLIDDLCTTGTTLNECARALKAAGVRRVHALVVAHG